MQNLATAESHSRWLDAHPQIFREGFNRTTFAFAHRLADHRLFELSRLLELTRSMKSRPQDIHYDAGDIRIDQRWDEAPVRKISVEEAIQQIDRSSAWVILKHAEKDPEYRMVLDECMSEIHSLIGRDIRRDVKIEEVILFITSPGRVSSYHIDRECNFLLQLHGDKTIHVFDQNDRTVLPEPEIERFWSVDNNAARYKKEYQNRARSYQLVPGSGVHVPINAPHWVQNGNNVSISMSVNFQFRDALRANIYRANYFLRKAGITPTPPGQSALRDALKRSAIGGAIAVRNMFSRSSS